MMKKILFSLLAATVLVACNNEDKTATNGSEIVINDLKVDLPKYINGAWVKADYIAAIEKEKSPAKAAAFVFGPSAMYINANGSDAKTNIFGPLNNHEGFEFNAIFEAGRTPNSFKTDATNLQDVDEEGNKDYQYELALAVENGEVILTLNRYEGDKLAGATKYKKVANGRNDYNGEAGIQSIVNEKLFTGSYTVLDKEGNSSEITLKTDGTISGSGPFVSYSVVTDYADNEDGLMEEIVLSTDKDRATYGFKITSDTTFLYTLVEHDGSEDVYVKFDKLVYKWVKKK